MADLTIMDRSDEFTIIQHAAVDHIISCILAGDDDPAVACLTLAGHLLDRAAGELAGGESELTIRELSMAVAGVRADVQILCAGEG